MLFEGGIYADLADKPFNQRCNGRSCDYRADHQTDHPLNQAGFKIGEIGPGREPICEVVKPLIEAIQPGLDPTQPLFH